MPYRRIQILAVAVPALALGLWESVRHRLLEQAVPSAWGNLVSSLVVALGAFIFVQVLMRMIDTHAREAARARERAAVVMERQRIGREMHDGVAQAIFYLNVKLDDLDRMLAAGQGEAARRELAAVRENLGETYARVRQVIGDLKRAAEDESLAEGLQRVVGEFRRLSSLQVALEVQGQGALPAAEQAHLLAVVQEALVNADRHAAASQVQIRAELGPGAIRIQVADNGRGFDPHVRRGGHGLHIMRERARILGADLSFQSGPGRGTVVTLTVAGVKP